MAPSSSDPDHSYGYQSRATHRAFDRLLVDKGLAVWSGQPFRQVEAELPDDVGSVVKRIESLF
ncbi:MAG: hypothetical protein ACO2YV_11985, partial [Pseudomonadales bacterium]